MGFKLGTERGNYAVGGNIRNKMRFHKEAGDPDVSPLEREVLGEEIIHATDIKLGKLAYTDNSVYHDGVTYPRENIDGKDMILVDGEWKEAGAHDFPWEKDAKI